MLPLAALLLSAPALGAQARGSIVGVVRDSADGLIAGAEVTVVGLNARAATDGSGVFRLDGIPAAVTQLQIRRLGYAPASVDVQVAGGQQARVEVRLAVLPYALAPVSVRERREVFDSRLAGFHSRRQKGVGHFFTREHLDRLSFRLADVLREVPGVRISPLRGAGRTVRLRGNCPALIVIDGTPATVGVFDIDMIDLASIEAVEVYSSASSVPAELMTARGLDRCGVVALWSRPSRSRRASSSGAPGAEVRAMLAAGRCTRPMRLTFVRS